MTTLPTFQYSSYNAPESYDSPSSYDQFYPIAIGQPGPSLPHLALPLVVGPGGAFNSVQQGTLAEVSQCVEMIVGTQQGQRTAVSKFGIPQQAFLEPGANAGDISSACLTWEPRASVQVTTNNTSPIGTSTVSISVNLAKQAA